MMIQLENIPYHANRRRQLATTMMALLLGVLSLNLACGGDTDSDAATTDAATADAATIDPSINADSTADGANAAKTWTTCAKPGETPAITEMPIGKLATMSISCSGDSGPVVLLLHGFPDFAYGWTKVMKILSKKHRVIAPNLRGYYTTSGPDAVSGYTLDILVEDVKALIEKATNAKNGMAKPGEVILVGHDWGGALAWVFASKYPKMIKKLVVINGPHPDVFIREYTQNPAQKSAASYMAFFTTPGSEKVLAGNDHKLLVDAFGTALTEADKVQYRKLYAGSTLVKMLNWYRANLDTDAGTMSAKNVVVTVPTLVMWGMKDAALLPAGNLKGLDTYVKDLRIQHFPTATHWVPHEQPGAVAKGIADFAADLPIAPTATEK